MVEVGPPSDEQRATAQESATQGTLLRHLEALYARMRSIKVIELPAMRLQVQPELPTHLDPDVWGMGVVELRERDFFESELREQLREVVPQALLRDLHRPVREVGWYPFEPMAPSQDHGGIRGYAEARAAQKLERMEPTVAVTAVVREEQARRRRWLDEPWKTFYRDDEPHPPVVVILTTYSG